MLRGGGGHRHVIPQLVTAQLALDPPDRVADGGNAIHLGHGNGGILGSNLSGLTRPGSLRLVHLVDHHSQEIQDFVIVQHLRLPHPDADVMQDGGGNDDDPGGVEVGLHHPEDQELPLPCGEHVLAHEWCA